MSRERGLASWRFFDRQSTDRSVCATGSHCRCVRGRGCKRRRLTLIGFSDAGNGTTVIGPGQRLRRPRRPRRYAEIFLGADMKLTTSEVGAAVLTKLKVPCSRISRAAESRAPMAVRASAPPSEMRRAPAASSSATGKFRFLIPARTLTGRGASALQLARWRRGSAGLAHTKLRRRRRHRIRGAAACRQDRGGRRGNFRRGR